MKIQFSQGNKEITANKIIRCRIKEDHCAIFHIFLNDDVVNVYCPTTLIECYEVDEVKVGNE